MPDDDLGHWGTFDLDTFSSATDRERRIVRQAGPVQRFPRRVSSDLEMGVPCDLDPGLFGESEKVILLIKQRRPGVVLPTLRARSPGCNQKPTSRRRAIKDHHGHPSEKDRLLVECEGAGAIKRRPEKLAGR